MSAKHTPGPWRIAHPEDLADKYGVDLLVRTDKRRVAIGLGPERGEPGSAIAETDANARLIAAAPEMFEALERAAAHLPSDEEILDYAACNDGRAMASASAARAVRAAIAKARGE